MSQNISIEQIKQLLDDDLKPIKDELADLSTKVDDLSTKVDKTMTKVDILVAKQQNSTATRSDRLQVVPRSDGSMPTVDFPESILQLLVADNESLPDGQRNTWNRSKSKVLLRQYEDANESESDTDDNEQSSKSRAQRLKLARLLGITNAQLNFAQMTL
ncbi:hypothetical protein VOLCADRAFT_95491 [Volvox carteri f. nagariensis]|uniref:Uncharacterized protein n=1 Tax=Volvox carteri f. nagariensis TaxID=3068 RepID=D8U7L6_VOLCA|nr:uncharacterized protein VOLCADRAFT_95491 [Volvox carteri f. nagariensis]EFJ44257.1 hypothetical protein VOLCADRAFT_95491 [Volvox carteri f. nagariensis]|eukprot:XP_002954616.1 hypothetical protein VOLCADRAFT_95491 [Volvox carteri f. nagariensis]